MKSKHTPAPWTYRNSRSYTNIYVGPDKNIASVWHETPEYISDEEIEANAKLIAAAPDMLEALENIQDILYTPGLINAGDLRRIVDEAIKKATGNE